MASLSGVIKRIISYTTAAIEKTDYFLLGNSSGEKKISWSTLINTIFQKQTKTIETSFLDIRLYRCGGVVYFRMGGYIGTSLTSTNKQIATLPEGFRPVAQLFIKYSVNPDAGTEIHLIIESNGVVNVRSNKDLASGTGCNFMTTYVWAGAFFDYE